MFDWSCPEVSRGEYQARLKRAGTLGRLPQAAQGRITLPAYVLQRLGDQFIAIGTRLKALQTHAVEPMPLDLP